VNKELEKYIVEKTHELIAAPSCCPEAKAAAQIWLKAVGTDAEAGETQKYVEELEDCILPIDNLIAFVSSEAGIAHFGADVAGELLEHAQEIKAEGEEYCDCPACAAALAIVQKKAELL
jgi:hypothetical protein